MDVELPIGLFDSGVGGLTVLKAINALLPAENLVYLGDTARVPYGTKSKEAITRYSLMAAKKLLSFGVKMVVIACNTATSAALPALSAELDPVPALGVVEPGAFAAVQATKSGNIAVIATEATINGLAYQKAIGRILPRARITARACTLLVPLAEEGWLEGEIAEGVIRRYLAGLFQAEAPKPDTLLLGCTHFPLFRDLLQKTAGNDVAIVDSASATATCALQKLTSAGWLNQSKGRGRTRFLTTDNPERFARTGSRFLGQDLAVSDIELVDL